MFELRIKTENEAFSDGSAGAEVARILREIADRLDAGETNVVAMDFDGNAVGLATLEAHHGCRNCGATIDDDEDLCNNCFD